MMVTFLLFIVGLALLILQASHHPGLTVYNGSLAFYVPLTFLALAGLTPHTAHQKDLGA